jgi:hypothetical protein
LDPQMLGRKVLMFSIIVGFVPSISISIYETLQDSDVNVTLFVMESNSFLAFDH